MDPQLEELVDSLLYEGYALYPYTPGATKNATPTPFGIVYPPAYAEATRARSTIFGSSACWRRGRAVGPRCASSSRPGERHEASRAASSWASPGDVEFDFAPLRGRVRLRGEPRDDGRRLRTVCVHNETRHDRPDAGRAEALHALAALHPRGTATEAGRFLSPLD